MTRKGFTKLWKGYEAEGRLVGKRTMFVGPDVKIDDLEQAVIRLKPGHIWINPECVKAWTLDLVLDLIQSFPCSVTLCIDAEDLPHGVAWPSNMSLMVSIDTDAPVDQVRVMRRGEFPTDIRIAYNFQHAAYDLYELDENIEEPL